MTFRNSNYKLLIMLFSGIKDNNAELSSNKVWHHLGCPYIIPSGKKRSLNCEKLLGKFRLKKLKIISGKITRSTYLQHLHQ